MPRKSQNQIISILRSKRKVDSPKLTSSSSPNSTSQPNPNPNPNQGPKFRQGYKEEKGGLGMEMTDSERLDEILKLVQYNHRKEIACIEEIIKEIKSLNNEAESIPTAKPWYARWFWGKNNDGASN